MNLSWGYKKASLSYTEYPNRLSLAVHYTVCSDTCWYIYSVCTKKRTDKEKQPSSECLKSTLHAVKITFKYVKLNICNSK